MEYFGEIGVPDVLTSPLLGPLMQLNPLTTSVDTETAILALSSDSEAISEKFTTCHGTYREHFAAIIEHLNALGDDAPLSEGARKCIPRSILHFIDARFDINKLLASLPLGVVKAKPLPPINLGSQPNQTQIYASIILKEVEAWRFHNDAVEAGAIEIAARFKECCSFGAGEFFNAIPMSSSEFTLRSGIFTAAARRYIGLLPAGTKPADVCLKCKLPLNYRYNTHSACGSMSRASCHSSWCAHGNNRFKLHNAVAEVLCSMWKALGGDAASDHKTLVNGRVLGQNPCTLPSGNRVDVILFGAGENGQDVFIDVSVACSESHASFESAMQTRENRKITRYKAEVEGMANCVFMPFVIGSSGGFGSSAIQVWNLLKLHAKNVQGRDWRHAWSSRSYCTRWRQALSVKFVKLSASFLLQRTLPINRMRALALMPSGLGYQEFAADGGVR